MHFRYPKPLRFRPNNSKKPVLSDADTKYLLSGKVVVEEKMDGKQLIVENERFVFCAEDLWKRHSIAYTIPARYMVFDIFELAAGQFLSPDGRQELIDQLMKQAWRLPEPLKHGIFPARILNRGRFELAQIEAMIELPSLYAIEGKMEGLIVKPDRILFYDEHLSGKVIREEFENGIATHHMRMPSEYNLINPNFAKGSQ